MAWVVWLMILVLTGCADTAAHRNGAVYQMKDGPDVSDYRRIDTNDVILRDYVTEVNLYAFYVFNYTKALNDYAATHGWRNLPMPPLCEQYTMPGLMEIPDFVFKRGIRSDEDIDLALAAYIRRLRIQMEENANRVQNAFAKHRAACMY